MITGADNVVKNIILAGERGVQAATTGLEIFALHVIRKSQDIAPYDEGELQEAIINEPVSQGVKVIGYDKPYAAWQHEDETLNHPGKNSKNPGRGAKGQAKYLESPLMQESGMLKNYIARELSKVL